MNPVQSQAVAHSRRLSSLLEQSRAGQVDLDDLVTGLVNCSRAPLFPLEEFDYLMNELLADQASKAEMFGVNRLRRIVHGLVSTLATASESFDAKDPEQIRFAASVAGSSVLHLYSIDPDYHQSALLNLKADISRLRRSTQEVAAREGADSKWAKTWIVINGLSYLWLKDDGVQLGNMPSYQTNTSDFRPAAGNG